MSSSYRSCRLGLSHWDPYALCRGGRAWCRRPTGFLQCFDTVGLVIWPVKIVAKMTYNVSSGTSSPYTTSTTTSKRNVYNPYQQQQEQKHIKHMAFIQMKERLYRNVWYRNGNRPRLEFSHSATTNSKPNFGRYSLRRTFLVVVYLQPIFCWKTYDAINRSLTWSIKLVDRKQNSSYKSMQINGVTRNSVMHIDACLIKPCKYKVPHRLKYQLIKLSICT